MDNATKAAQLNTALYARIITQAPIVGCCLDQRRIDFATEATPAQRAAAQAILDSFDPVQAQTEVDAEEADNALLQEFLKRIRTHCQRIEDESKARDQELQSRLAHLVNWAKTKGYTP